MVAPSPVTNREFTKALGRVLHRPTIFPLPAVVARLLLGEMAGAPWLANARVFPFRLEGSGYRFRFPQLEAALRHLRQRERRGGQGFGQFPGFLIQTARYFPNILVAMGKPLLIV